MDVKISSWSGSSVSGGPVSVPALSGFFISSNREPHSRQANEAPIGLSFRSKLEDSVFLSICISMHVVFANVETFDLFLSIYTDAHEGF